MKQNCKLFNCPEKNPSWLYVLDSCKDLEGAWKGRKFLQLIFFALSLLTFFAPSLLTFFALPKFGTNLIMFAENWDIRAWSPKSLSLSHTFRWQNIYSDGIYSDDIYIFRWHDVWLNIYERNLQIWFPASETDILAAMSAGVMFRRADWKASKSSFYEYLQLLLPLPFWNNLNQSDVCTHIIC